MAISCLKTVGAGRKEIPDFQITHLITPILFLKPNDMCYFCNFANVYAAFI
jgi:hypothetical protein